MAEQKKHTPIKRIRRTALIAAALAAALAVTGVAADYVINHRTIFFFDSLEALATARQAEDPSAETTSYTVPNSAEESRDMETVAEGNARVMKHGRYGDETVLSDETDDSDDTPWERRRVTAHLHEQYGYITTEYLTGAAYADHLTAADWIDWDLSAISETMTADEGGQLVAISRDSGSTEIVMLHALLGYTTPEGKRFQIEYNYDAEGLYTRNTEYILSSEYDHCGIHTTPDHVEVLIKAYDGQIWAKAGDEATKNAVFIYTTGCTVAEMEAILDSLNLASALRSGA